MSDSQLSSDNIIGKSLGDPYFFSLLRKKKLQSLLLLVDIYISRISGLCATCLKKHLENSYQADLVLVNLDLAQVMLIAHL